MGERVAFNAMIFESFFLVQDVAQTLRLGSVVHSACAVLETDTLLFEKEVKT